MTCPHAKLTLLEGELHPSGKDYKCDQCGEQFRAEPLQVTVSYGKPPEGEYAQD